MKRRKAKSFEEKNPEFVSEVVGLAVSDLEKRISSLAKGIKEIEDTEKADSDLQEAKAKVKEFKAPYNDSKKDAKAKLNYVINLIKEKGGA